MLEVIVLVALGMIIENFLPLGKKTIMFIKTKFNV